MIRELRYTGADCKLLAQGGQSIYHMAIENDKVLPIIYFKPLIEINIKNDEGMTPLIYACEMNKETTTYYLISNGADLNAQDNSGKTALHRAAHNGNTKLVRRLVARGANLEIRDEDGARPIEIAMHSRFTNVTKALVFCTLIYRKNRPV